MLRLKPSYKTLRTIFTCAAICGLIAITTFSYETSELRNQFGDIYSRIAWTEQVECSLPHLDPYDASILPYLQKADPLICRQLQYELTYMDQNGTIRRNQTEFDLLNSRVNCQQRCVFRGVDDFTLNFTKWNAFRESFTPDCEFTEIACKLDSFPFTTAYSNVHAKVIPWEPASYGGRNRTSDVSTGIQTAYPLGHQTNNSKEAIKQYDVIIFVVDSMSRSNWIRNLPKTYKALTEDYGSFIFEGMTKVGDNSFPNAAAFLTGKKVRVNGYESELPSDMTNGNYDDWPLIWNEFRAQGYQTLYAEDYIDYNLFTYLAKGFNKQPVDHYFRTYWLNVYNSYLHRRSSPLCYGNRKLHNIQLDYLKRFIESYQNRPKFALHWLTELGHDFMHIVNVAEEDFANFFTEQRENFRNSFVFVLGDHGHRFDPIRKTIIGRLEERLPFFSLHVPQEILLKKPELSNIIRNNSKKLSSFFDMHATMRFILEQNENGWTFLENKNSQSWNETVRENQNKTNNRGYNLLEELPKMRNCTEAGIPEEFCVCELESERGIHEEAVKKSAHTVITHINEQLQNYSDCARLSLKSINYAHSKVPNKRLLRGHTSLQISLPIRVSITVSPSDALFEALVKIDLSTNQYYVIGDISRINRYGNQGDCIKEVNLRKLCFCS